MNISVPDAVFANKKNAWNSTPTLVTSEGKKLTKDDYTIVSYTYEYDSVLNDGRTVLAGTIVSANDIPTKNTIIRVNIEGKNNFNGSISTVYRIIENDISKAKVTIPVQYYDGKPVTFTKNQIIVTVGGNVLDNSEFEIESFTSNAKIGNGTVTIKGLGNYGGSKAFTFKIAAKPQKATVIYNGNGNTGGKTADSSSNIVSNNGYIRKGYTFVEWNTREDGKGISYNPYDRIVLNNEATILYAIWNKDVYEISYELNGGSRVGRYLTSYTVTDDTYNLPTPTFDGYKFNGWYTDTKLKTKITAIKRGSAQDYKLYAKWTMETYSIKYVLNGGSKVSNIAKYTIDTDYDFKNPTKTGYLFLGWYSDEQLTCRVDRISRGSTGNLTLYAGFTPITYYIRFNNNGVDEGTYMPTMQIRYDESAELTPVAFSEAGFAFTGWNTKADGSGTTYKDRQVVKNLTNVNRNTINLYAQWKLEAPSNFGTYKDGYNRVPLYWDSVNKADGYYIYRSTKATSGFKKVLEINDKYTTFIYDTTSGISENSKYFYKIAAYYTDESGAKHEGKMSDAINACTSLKPKLQAYLDTYPDYEGSYSTGYGFFPDLYTKNSGKKQLYILNPIYIRPQGMTTTRTAYIWDMASGQELDENWYCICEPKGKWYYSRFHYSTSSIDFIDDKTIVSFDFVYDEVRYKAKCMAISSYRGTDTIFEITYYN